jgi:hypothetical protein
MNDPWEGKMLSSGGKLILMNSCLSSIPTYIMRFYRLTDGQHKDMDSISEIFFVRGSNTFKYHMAKWEALATPREFGGLRIINTRIMNGCMLVKWVWRLVNKEDSLWSRILRGEYLRDKDFFSSTDSGFTVLVRVVQS